MSPTFLSRLSLTCLSHFDQNNICLAIVMAALLNYVDKDWESGWRISLGLQTVTSHCFAHCLLTFR